MRKQQQASLAVPSVLKACHPSLAGICATTCSHQSSSNLLEKLMSSGFNIKGSKLLLEGKILYQTNLKTKTGMRVAPGRAC